jgi:hypothetical protein
MRRPWPGHPSADTFRAVRTPSPKVQAWAQVAGEVLAILLGAALIAWGWKGFGETLLVVGVIGLVVSLLRLWRLSRNHTGR